LWESLRDVVDNVPAPVSVTVKVQRPMLAKFLLLHGAELAAPPPQEPTDTESTDPVQLQVRFRSLGSAEQLLHSAPPSRSWSRPNCVTHWSAGLRRPSPCTKAPQQADSGHRPDASAREQAHDVTHPGRVLAHRIKTRLGGLLQRREQAVRVDSRNAPDRT
jgi:hypothetical protein